MEGEELSRALDTILRAIADAEPQSRDATSTARAVDLLIEILAGRGVLNAGHLRLLQKARERACSDAPRVRLRTYVDKYQEPASAVDCENRLHFCQARCCTFEVELSAQDVEEGQLLWNIEQPYLLRRDADGYCSHFDRRTRACGSYQTRPAACRAYDCRTDRRIWIDFDKMIPAPH